MVLQSDTTESSHQWNPADAWSSKTSLTAYVRSTCWLLRTKPGPQGCIPVAVYIQHQTIQLLDKR